MYTGAENETIQGLINAILLIIPAGAVARTASCAFSVIHDDEEQGKYKRRAKNTVMFAVVAECAVILVNMIYHYFG